MRCSPIFALAVTLAAAIALAAPAAWAVPITAGSQIDFGGSVHPLGGANVYSSTGSDFRTSGANSPGIAGTINVTNTSGGAFSPFNSGTCPSSGAGGCGTIRDLLNYVPNSSTLNNPLLPVTNFLTFTLGAITATFDLLDFSSWTLLPTAQTLGVLVLAGSGILHFVGYDDTPAVFTLTAQGPGNTSFSGSLVVKALPVSEPSSLLLLGFGLLGVGFLSVRRRQEGTGLAA